MPNDQTHNTMQTYPLLPTLATPFEPSALPVPTGELYLQVRTLHNVLLLAENPLIVSHHRRLLADSVQALSRALDRAIDQIDPLILEALSSHPVQA